MAQDHEIVLRGCGVVIAWDAKAGKGIISYESERIITHQSCIKSFHGVYRKLFVDESVRFIAMKKIVDNAEQWHALSVIGMYVPSTLVYYVLRINFCCDRSRHMEYTM